MTVAASALEDLKTVVSTLVAHANTSQAALESERAAHAQTVAALDAANEELVQTRDALVAMKGQLAPLMPA